jgi:hypothetical protein
MYRLTKILTATSTVRQLRTPVVCRNVIRLTPNRVNSIRSELVRFDFVWQKFLRKINNLRAVRLIQTLGISTTRPIYNKALAQEQLDLGTEYLNKGSIDLVSSREQKMQIQSLFSFGSHIVTPGHGQLP